MSMLRRRSFVGPIVYLGREYASLGLDGARDVIRDRAQAFVNEQVGLDNVISIAEHAMTFGPFSVVVWYRDVGRMAKPIDDDFGDDFDDLGE